MEKYKRKGDRGEARTHVLRITDLILYLHATHALCDASKRRNKNETDRIT
jgi:hypothetical protein